MKARAPITPSELRADIYNILDRVLKTGKPVEVRRKGKVLRIVPEPKPDKLSRLKKRDCIVGDPESIVHMDWLKYWNELKNLE
ncbi:MAG: type II toxin-antitoxin system Phd/YefM family antitoxin [Acidobacteria bacterium]|nr:type II toxin-antitoxin system Phd/YefM family antitoxin [Acidobacteriota bacterium]MBI3470593.1 type II toxin-antitoxin system Phd/YefM family antitoxin [Candidatus Solibacter usitatus]